MAPLRPLRPSSVADVEERVVACRKCPRLVEHRERSARLKPRRYATDGAVVVDVTDAFCPWNAGRWRITITGMDNCTCCTSREAWGVSAFTT